MVYTGIGSRETPIEVLDYFIEIGKVLADHNFTLRSGHAKGADIAFEEGADLIKGKKEIYLPWYKFNGSMSDLIVKDERAFEIAKKFHPYWGSLKSGGERLQARNSHQILGWDLETLTDFVVCWTKNGKGSGGTGQALRIAKHYGVPIIDVGGYSSLQEVNKDLFTLIKKIREKSNDK